MNIDSSLEIARLSAIVQSSQDAIISKQFDGTITSWNGAAEKIFGYKAEEIIGNNITMIIPDELLEEEKEIISKVRKGEIIEHYETTRRTKSGDRISIAITVSPIKDVNGVVIGISKIAHNITEEKEAKRKEAILAAIIDSSDDAIISKTLGGFITSWNSAAEKMFGYTESEAIGKHISIIIPPERIAEEKVIIENILAGKKIDHFETVRVAKNGKMINISLTVSPVKNKDGEVIGASKVARDITEKAEMERQRILYTKKLQELNNHKDEFMALASHELKTPLTIVKANLQVLQLQMQITSDNGFLDKSLSQVSKLADLIDNLLDISKIQVGKLEIQPAPFDLGVLLKEIIETIQQTTVNHNIVYEDHKKDLTVNADSRRIEQVIINILTNAIKYSPEPGDIVITAFKEKSRIMVSIKDNGIGISAEDLPKVFDRYYRVSDVASTVLGSGIGLFISSEIIKKHGGDIWAESEADKGSTFYFTLPASV
ncbi:MAG: PAS domain S-box protein [Ginsengibacter sp.]